MTDSESKEPVVSHSLASFPGYPWNNVLNELRRVRGELFWIRTAVAFSVVLVNVLTISYSDSPDGTRMGLWLAALYLFFGAVFIGYCVARTCPLYGTQLACSAITTAESISLVLVSPVPFRPTLIELQSRSIPLGNVLLVTKAVTVSGETRYVRIRESSSRSDYIILSAAGDRNPFWQDSILFPCEWKIVHGRREFQIHPIYRFCAAAVIGGITIITYWVVVF